jgi:hypothetical protein
LDSICTSFGQSFMKTMTSLSMFLTPNLHLCRDVKTSFVLKILFCFYLWFWNTKHVACHIWKLSFMSLPLC